MQLWQPGQAAVSDRLYNQLFTMHGTIMLMLFATPLFIAFANVIVRPQIGVPDVAFPQRSLLAYYLIPLGGLMVISGFLTPGGAADFGWFADAPLNNALYGSSAGGDLSIAGADRIRVRPG